MKYLFNLLAFLIGSCLVTTSCTDNSINSNDSPQPVEPGVYYVGMTLGTLQGNATKGVVDNKAFDEIYEYDYIYLHKTGEATGTEPTSIRLSVWNCCEENQKGIRYRICIQEDGSAKITPIYVDEDGNYQHDENHNIDLAPNETCYFSSWETDEWQLDNNQISTETVGDESYQFFYRNQKNNREIYRSETEYNIDDLSQDGDLTLVRACAGFTLVGLFYDSSAGEKFDDDGTMLYDMDADKFEKIMGDSPDNWYIKIYIGGSSFSNQYDIKEEKASTNSNGYYSSGDGGKYVNEDIDTQQYLRFSKRLYLDGSMYNGYGYYTRTQEEGTNPLIGNYLFTPVTGEQVDVYILIKHWTGGDGTSPNETWLNSDEGALQTKVDLSNTSAIYPANNYYYRMGLLMDINTFKQAWEDNYSSLSTTTTPTVLTKSPSGATVREFTLKDAKVICDVY